MEVKKIRLLVGPLAVWICTVVVWGIYRNLFMVNEIIEELFFKPLVFVWPILFYLHKNNSLNLKSLGLIIENKKSIIFWGGFFGTLVALEGVFIMHLKGRPLQVSQFALVVVLTNLIVSLATAISEEILYRGFLLQKIAGVFQKQFVSNAITALLFMVAHVGIAMFAFNYQGSVLISYLVTILVSGFIYGFIFQRSHSVYAAIIAHVLWNFTNTFFI